ncbi:transcription elongation factor GreAB [Spirosoma aureum]|uniref:Transcription elongation factor GreAB n=1 Tax=Spirosoma aureum TaxID=2692134 RepID=A0A6G9AT80_9BACT|nr:GreA/GreB family elongation factor [Spirosoma aureum]QIP15485.1 transcription elongation factor GreAB [Spirosoma aureum]
MSRAFLKNESAEDPVVIPARAPLPPGATNYVTLRGLALLQTELTELENERMQVQLIEREDTERARQLALINGRIANLNQRIATARVVDVRDHPRDEVRFGATVSLHNQAIEAKQANQKLTIVGVDEADASQGRIAFTAPIARALLGKRVGETIELPAKHGTNVLEITEINYEE